MTPRATPCAGSSSTWSETVPGNDAGPVERHDDVEQRTPVGLPHGVGVSPKVCEPSPLAVDAWAPVTAR